MDKRWHALPLWAPRVLGLLCAFWLGLFALDVFGMEGGFWEIMAGFLIHLIPSALVVIVVVLGWRWPWLGGLVFLALGAVYVASNRPHPWLWDLAIAGPLAVTGVLFLANWLAERPGGRIKPA